MKIASIFAALFCALLPGCGGNLSTAATTTGSPGDCTAFSNATLVAINGYTGDAMEPFICKNGEYLFFNNRNDPATNTDIYYASRVDDQTFTFVGPLPGVNSPQLDAVASLDSLGNFYFISTRSYSTSLSTVYTGTFSGSAVNSVALVPGISLLRPGWVNFDAEISADGQTLWFDDGHFSATGELQAATIAMAERQGGTFVRQADSANVLQTINASGLNYAPCISADGLELFFTRVNSAASGASPAIYRAARADVNSAFEAPQQLAVARGFVEAPSLSGDGRLLYFHKLVNGKFVIYVAQR
jgi:hypothetical protein